MLVVITSPTATPEELTYYGRLFEEGLQCLHLRLPGYSRTAYEAALSAIPPRYRSRVVLCDHFELVDRYGVGGIHLRRDNRHEYARWHGRGKRISVSAHSISELETLPFIPTYALLSPVYDSISKEGYKAALDFDECRRRLPLLPFPVIGLGGVTPAKMNELTQYGFAGGAVLGYISRCGRYMSEAFRRFPRPEVLSIAGHDPSSGAGLVADAMKIQSLGGLPLTVSAALTIQDDKRFDQVITLPEDHVEEPLVFLMQAGHIPLAAKIGMVSSLSSAHAVAHQLRRYGVRYVIWDPVLAPTAATDPDRLYDPQDNLISDILRNITLITPNRPEAEALWGTTDPDQLHQIARMYDVAILLKGGHSDDHILSTDLLIQPSDEAPLSLSVPRTMWDKHGTGCMLSAAIATRLAQGFTLQAACRMGQWQVDQYRRSSSERVGNIDYSLSQMKEEKLTSCTLQFITNGVDEEEILTTCRAVLDGGIRWIQLRMKDASHEERVATAKALKSLMDRYVGSTLIIDDDIDAVLESDADGVHLGLLDESPVEARRRLGEGKIIGGTCNTIEHLHRRALEGVDYVGVGPYRHTTTKANLSPILGVEGLRAMAGYNHTLLHPIPMVGIGGIVPDDLRVLADIGIDGIALSGVIHRAEHITDTARQIQEACDRCFLK